MIIAFSKSQTEFKKGAVVLAREAKDNGYKLNLSGLTVFLDNCCDEIGEDAYNFYQMCIPFAIQE